MIGGDGQLVRGRLAKVELNGQDLRVRQGPPAVPACYLTHAHECKPRLPVCWQFFLPANRHSGVMLPADMAATAEKTKITREDCEQFESLNETRLSLERQARALQKQLAVISEKLLAFTKENGGKLRTVKQFGFLLAVQLKSSSPSWKDEFIRVAGLEEAERVAAEAAKTMRESLSLQRA